MFGERVVEIPWVLERVIKNGNNLDIGSSESPFSWKLLAISKHLTLLDVRPIPGREFFNEDLVSTMQVDIRNIEIPIETYDTITCVSTLEHIGCAGYEQKADEYPIQEQRIAVEIMMRCVSEKGRVLITVPFGKHENGGWYIVYDKKDIDKVICEFDCKKTFFTLTDRDRNKYEKCNIDDCPETGLDVYKGTIRATSVACLELSWS